MPTSIPANAGQHAATSAAHSTTTISLSVGRGAGALARDRADRTAAGLTSLFASRPELRGVHAPADLAEDFVRWSA